MMTMTTRENCAKGTASEPIIVIGPPALATRMLRDT